jgi:hypothetical protein
MPLYTVVPKNDEEEELLVEAENFSLALEVFKDYGASQLGWDGDDLEPDSIILRPDLPDFVVREGEY